MLNLRNVTSGDVSVLWAVLTFYKMINLKIREEPSAKQSISPKGQFLQREQFDEAVTRVTNTEQPHGFNCIISHNLCVVLFSARCSIRQFASPPSHPNPVGTDLGTTPFNPSTGEALLMMAFFVVRRSIRRKSLLGVACPAVTDKSNYNNDNVNMRHPKVNFHLYVDDMQLYLTFKSSFADLAKLAIEDCV